MSDLAKFVHIVAKLLSQKHIFITSLYIHVYKLLKFVQRVLKTEGGLFHLRNSAG